ncbi:DUF4326 domain-containing protein [Streptomyces pseudogriseolus]|uniref:DUF4326 domain-containing protein n=1 Tax=Streptomyces pseudogriseolus TaxID=36817 RepID=UPI003FA1AFE6
MTTTPRRIKRERTPGWRLVGATTNPLGAVIVSRPSRFGNPFTIAGAQEYGGAETTEQARELCTTAFRQWLRGNRDWWMGPKADATRERILADLHLLRGRDLACTCPLPEPGQPDHCHAAVLLELANEPVPAS